MTNKFLFYPVTELRQRETMQLLTVGLWTVTIFLLVAAHEFRSPVFLAKIGAVLAFVLFMRRLQVVLGGREGWNIFWLGLSAWVLKYALTGSIALNFYLLTTLFR